MKNLDKKKFKTIKLLPVQIDFAKRKKTFYIGKKTCIYLQDNLYVNDFTNEYLYFSEDKFLRLGLKRGCGNEKLATIFNKINREY